MRPALLTPLFRGLDSVSGVGEKLARLLKNLCGPHVADVLWHLPVDVKKRPVLECLDQVDSSLGTLQMCVTEHLIPRTRRQPYRVLGVWQNVIVELVFFNYHKAYLAQKLPEGKSVWVSGKIERVGGQLKILHPDYISFSCETIPVFESVYPLTAGVSGGLLRRTLTAVLPQVPVLPEWQDGAFMAREGFLPWRESLIKIHLPQSDQDVILRETYRRRLAYDELLANQLALFLVRRFEKKQNGLAILGTGTLTDKLLASLPFELTGAQKRVIDEIKNDLASPLKMARLLQGDVGAGKTLVALSALLTVIEAGYQGAFMAPTDILARQHFEVCTRLCAPLGITPVLLTGREKGKRRAQLLQAVAAGEIPLLIGTHALFTEDVCFSKLGLAVVDEQHKFGVYQRLALGRKHPGTNLLAMTATPIPRTLALTAYGDMDISVLDEKPIGRQPIQTLILSSQKIPELLEKLKRKLAQEPALQVYWVCPLVAESEKSDLTAATRRYESLKEHFGGRVALVHGKMKGPEKDAVMARFASGEAKILVSTTVIEVGVDVKTAGMMIIEHAERFGLAGLHQLRGRIGRGSDAAVCLLIHGKNLTPTARERLRVMRATQDGFEIAKADLKLRGAGDVLGDRQSGFPEFLMADLARDDFLLETASKDAKMILNTDPTLSSPRGEALKHLLYLFKKDSEIHTLKAG